MLGDIMYIQVHAISFILYYFKPNTYIDIGRCVAKLKDWTIDVRRKFLIISRIRLSGPTFAQELKAGGVIWRKLGTLYMHGLKVTFKLISIQRTKQNFGHDN